MVEWPRRTVTPILVVVAVVLLTAGCPGPPAIDHSNVCFDLSPDGNTVVFSAADGDLYLLDVHQKSATQLTRTASTESYPSFSPDGKSVLFSVAGAGQNSYHICEIDLATKAIEQLTHGEQTSDILPRYRPESRRVVFARAHRSREYSLGGRTWDNWDVCELDKETGSVTRLTTEKYYRTYRVIPRKDGSLIYAADELPPGGNPDAALYTLDTAGVPQRLIPSGPEFDRNVHAWASDPIVGPDGVTIAFCSDRDRPFWYDLCVCTPNETRRLVGSKSRYNRYPDFFPDGSRLSFLAGTTFDDRNRPIFSLWQVSLKTGRISELASSTLFTNPSEWLRTPRGEQCVPQP